MKKNILKKIIVLFSLGFTLVNYTSVFAEDSNPTPDIIPPVVVSDPMVPETATINLKIYSGDTVLFNGPETVTACPESLEVDAPINLNAKCAIEQSGLSNTWTWYDTNFKKDSSDPKTLGVLDELGGISSDNANYIYWGWFSNLNYGSTAINKHTLSSGEEFLLVYNSHPLRMSVSKNSGVVGETIIFTTEEKTNFNSDWSDLIWTPLKEATVNLGDQSCVTTENGTCSIILNKSGSLKAIGSKSLYVPSSSLNIEVTDIPVISGGGTTTIVHNKIDIDKALQYISSKQNVNGSFSSDLYTDWAAIAIASSNKNISAKEKIINYLKSNSFVSNTATDNERHAMALMSLGIDPYVGTNIDYIKKIVDSFDGTQFGDGSLVNDDIFAIFPLLKAGYSQNNDMIQKDISFILSKQGSDGSWGSVDLTAAAVQALSLVHSSGEINQAKIKAEQYLKDTQLSDGSFGNSFSTSWVLQYIGVIGADESSWMKNNLNLNDYLFKLQQTDGGVDVVTNSDDSRVWATAYAIPASVNVSWDSVMQSFDKPQVVSNTKTEEPVIVKVKPVIEEIIPDIKKDEVKKIEEKKNINRVFVKKQNTVKKQLEIIEKNSLVANVSGVTQKGISFRNITQNAVNSITNVFHSIGSNFYSIFAFIFGL